MAKETKIEWCDHTFNPVIGCAKVSPGCANCYAEANDRRRKWTREGWGPGKPRKRTSEAYWKAPIQWNAEAEKLGVRKRVFCASLADWLDPEWTDEIRADLYFWLIRETRNLDWLLLTKRPEHYKDSIIAMFDTIKKWTYAKRNPNTQLVYDSALTKGHPLGYNIWQGVSIENQEQVWRAEQALEIPARFHFVSAEPLLGPLDLSKFLGPDFPPHMTSCAGFRCSNRIDWVIVGGESGPNARPMDPDWARDLRDQCKKAGVAFFMKQLGGTKRPMPEIPSDLMIREFPA